MMTEVYFVEGNIGSGKSTLLRALERQGFTVLYEPVDEWTRCTDDGEEGILTRFYKSKRRYSLAMELTATTSRVRQLVEFLASRPVGTGGKVIVERSFLTDRHVFAVNLVNDGDMSDTEWDAFLANSKLLESVATTAALSQCSMTHLYLKTPPDVCNERRLARDRPAERAPDGVTPKYLVDLHDRHCEWLESERMINYVYVIDGTGTEQEVLAHALKILK